MDTFGIGHIDHSAAHTDHHHAGGCDEYGNPIHHHGTAGAGHVDHHAGGYGEHGGTGAGQLHAGGVAPGALRRSGSSSSSSSSEDDGLGGRRKKKRGLKDKIKKKLPGGHKDDQILQQHYGGHGVVAPGEQAHEKKGMMEKIKEKLPGRHSH